MREFLTKKFAGIPGWGWGAIVLGALLIAVLRKASSTPIPVVTPTAAAQAPPAPVSDQGVPAPGIFVPAYNEEWARKANNYLFAQGYDPYTARKAINNYLSGKNVTAAESTYIAQAKTYVGAPPEPLGSPLSTFVP